MVFQGKCGKITVITEEIMKRIRKSLILIVVLLLTVSLAAFSGCTIVSVNPNQGNGGGVIADPSNTSKNLGVTYDVESVSFQKSNTGERFSLEDAIEKVFNSVVVIQTTLSGGVGVGCGIMLDVDVAYRNESVNRNDFVYILTCHHVIADGTKLAVYLPKYDAEKQAYEYETYEFTGTLIGGDKLSDVAMVRIDLTNNSYGLQLDSLTKAKINDSALSVGQDVFAVGNPTGELPGTVTKGVVSFINREVSVEDIGTMTLLQVDAAINSGNSGGGLFNLAGELVGVVNAGADDYQGLNFAIPIFGENGAENVAYSLIKTSSDNNYGYLAGRWKFDATFTSSADRYGGYVQISSVTPGGTLSKAGARSGDVLISLSGEKNGKEYHLDEVTSLTDFSDFYDDLQRVFVVGDRLTMVVQRGRNKVTLDVTLEQYIYNSLT